MANELKRNVPGRAGRGSGNGRGRGRDGRNGELGRNGGADDGGLLAPSLLARLARLEFQTRKTVAGGGHGERRSRSAGAGIEFRDFRPYEEGDDLRYVDRHAYARLDRFYVRLFSRDDSLPVQIFLDTSASMGYGEPSKLALAARLAAGLGFVALNGGGSLSVSQLATNGVRTSSTLSGARQYSALCDWLTGATAQGGTHLQGVTAARPHARGGLAFLLSDLMGDGLQAAVRALALAGWEVFVLHVLSPDELHPTFDGNLRCIDAETQDEIDVTWDAETATRYAEELQRWQRELRRTLSACEARYLMISSDQTPEQLFLSELLRAGLLR